MRNFTDKVAFVTGAASGIGLGMTRAMLSEGMRVVLADFDEQRLVEAGRALDAPDRIHLVTLDVTDRERFAIVVQEALDRFGKIHVLCNNVGTGRPDAVEDPEFAVWDQTMRINLGGVVNGIKTIVPLILSQKEGGHVVNTASIAGIVPLPGMAAYSTSKYAIRGLSEALRLSLAPHGIGVSCLYPGPVKTRIAEGLATGRQENDADRTEVGRFLSAATEAGIDPLDVGRMVVAGIRDNAPAIFTHGEFVDEFARNNRAMEAAFPPVADAGEQPIDLQLQRRNFVESLMTMPPLG